VRNHKKALLIFLLMVAVVPLGAQAPSTTDLNAIQQIKDEGFNHSQVMDIMSYLTDVYGPRLTNSPNIKQAADWTMSKLKEWQLANVHLEPWGPFGKGWSNERFSLQVISPRPFPVIAYAKAWTPGTNGVVTAEAVWAPIQKVEDIEQYRGKLKGKFVLTAQQPEIPTRAEAQFHRYTDPELVEESTQPVPTARAEDRFARFRAQRELNDKIQKFLVEEGIAAWLEPSPGDDGTVFTSGGGGRDPKDPPAPLRVAVANENYGRLVRMLEKKVRITLQADIQNKFFEDDLNSFNIVAEIPGSEKAKADEIVMVGAHFDSWHAGTGATDNGAGSGVMLEAIRILKTTGVKLRRTVRIGLWTGEEQGLLGSRAYVKQHFGSWEPDPAASDKENLKLLSEQAKLDAYYNVDNGSGKIRGIYLQGNEAIAPLFSQWMEPFHNLGMTTLTIRNTGGTDHLAFDAVGLPGFQFIQDPLDYDTRTHHSNMDVYERIQEPDMKQMAVIVASFVYLTANRDEMVPRKPLQKTRPKRTSPF
jgi:carboxypeptidase Q